MVTAGELENQIFCIEGFYVTIKQGGKNVRSDKDGFADWPYQKQSKGTMTVNEWIRKFQIQYPGYDVEVSSRSNVAIRGNTLLKNIR